MFVLISISSLVAPVLALAAMGLAFGLLLAISSKVFHVEQDERLPLIEGVLPGANCGGCGYAGCSNYASAVIAGEAACNKCTVGGAETSAEVAKIMGVEVLAQDRLVAYVGCSGGLNAKTKFQYEGIEDCLAATKVAGGPLECNFGCLGFGTCIKACPYDAIAMTNGAAVIRADKCRACGKCVVACPRKIIELVSEKQEVFVSCRSKDRGPVVNKICDVGCIGCMLCQKKCEHDAIHVENSLATIDYSKCTNCGECVAVCPRKIIEIHGEKAGILNK